LQPAGPIDRPGPLRPSIDRTTLMKAETQAVVSEIEQSLDLLRRLL
jgi:hypothetical protein